jgi:hypothetical protein
MSSLEGTILESDRTMADDERRLLKEDFRSSVDQDMLVDDVRIFGGNESLSPECPLECWRAPFKGPAKMIGVGVRWSWVLVALLSCAHAPIEQPQLALPPPDAKLYAGLGASAWKNPHLIVVAVGVRVTALGVDTTVPVSALAGVLGRLPKGAWPYGGVVAIDPGALFASHGGDMDLAVNYDNLVELLKRLGLAVEYL